MKLFFYLFAMLLLFANNLFAQANWKNYYNNETLQILQKEQDCNDEQNGIHKQYIFFKIVNKTNEAIKVAYKKELWYNNTCTTCKSNNEEQRFSIVLNPKEVIEGNCAKNNKALSIFAKMLNMQKSELTKFELTDIKITAVK